jgi:3-dehydroquinate synthase
MADIITIPVCLDNRSYDILIGKGLIEQAGIQISTRFNVRSVAVITDENVAKLHLAALRHALETSNMRVVPIIIPAGEKSKSFEMLETVVRQILAAKLERGDLVIAFGGGVVGDLAGFAASIARRGMPFVQIPTSLLAQVDSSVGGKTGINTFEGKNLVGAFYQPQLVLVDTKALSTLPLREFRAGYAEMAKYGLIENSDFFEFLEKNWREVFARTDKLDSAIATSCRAKAAVVARDEHESGDRALLNLGHTFGHALEAFVGYDSARLVHGEGVSIGMVMAHKFSNYMNHLGHAEVLRVEAHLHDVGLPTKISHIKGSKPDVETLLGFMAQDKKVINGKMTFILTTGIGRSFIAKDVPTSAVESFLKTEI